MKQDRPVFVSRDYGDRAVPPEAVAVSVGDEEDVTVWMWRESEDGAVFLQQGYDLICLDGDALRELIAGER